MHIKKFFKSIISLIRISYSNLQNAYIKIIDFSEPSIGSRGEIWRESRNSLNFENEKFVDIRSSFSWTGPNALARSSLLERQEKLQFNCEEIPDKEIRRGIVDPKEFHNILVDEQHKLLYCYVPKVKTLSFFKYSTKWNCSIEK